LRAGHQCIVYDLHPEAAQGLIKDGAMGTTSLEEFVHTLAKPSAVWLMVPVAVVDQTLNALVPLLEHADKAFSAIRYAFGSHLEQATTPTGGV